MLRKWLIAAAAVVTMAGAGITPSFGAACTPTTPPNTTGVTQNSVLELLESICSNASAVSVGGFTPSAANARGTPVSVTTSDSSGNLPTGAVVVVSNAGTTNPMYCNVNGVAATASDQYISAGGGWFAFTIPVAVTTLHCIATVGTTTANMIGGSGLPTGTGGGSGGGGGGAVTVADGADQTFGAKADATCGTSTGACSLEALIKYLNTQAALIATNSAAGIPLGGFWIGSTDIVVTPSANFTRPANTTTYVIGQLVANNTTAGSVVPLSWTVARVNNGNFYLRRARITLSSKSITNTKFQLHFFTSSPTIANGDGATFSTSMSTWFCSMTVTIGAPAGTDVSSGIATPDAGSECNGVATGGAALIYGLIEAQAAYTPASGETISVIPEVHQN